MLETYFSVREGSSIEDALAQASCFLASAKAATNALGNSLDNSEGGSDLSYSAAYLIEMAKALVDAATESTMENNAANTAASAVGAGKPEPTMENTEGATDRYDLACSLSCDISYLNDLLNVIDERVGKGRDGPLFSLLEAVMPRMKQALETVEKLEAAV